jgi:Domain of unknown function (DUF1963)
MSTPPTPFIDSLLAKTFRTDANGRLLFAPFGPQQKTFIVPPDRAKAHIHFLRRFYGVLLGGMALGGLAFGSRGVVAAVPAGVAWYFVYIWRFTRDLQIAGTLPADSTRQTSRQSGQLVETREIAPLPPILVSRRPRGMVSDWDDARSWLGGQPRLGDLPWPRAGAEQRPLTHVAWIDLSHVRARVRRTPLPVEGALAFFIGAAAHGYRCAVLHVTHSTGADTDPPSDAPAAYTPYGEVFPISSEEGARAFPRWPVELTPLIPQAPAEEQDFGLVVERHLHRRQYFLDMSAARSALGGESLPILWHSAHHLAACLRAAVQKLDTLRASRARYGASSETLAAFDKGRPAFSKFVDDVGHWVAGQGAWRPMSEDDANQLRSLLAQAHGEYASYAKVWSPGSLKELELTTLRAVAVAQDPDAWAALPRPVRDLIDRNYLLPANDWHQMFGRGVDIQGNAAGAHADDYLLMQLVYDDLMEWRFGDIGAFQFWIAPADLQQQRWSAVQVTFECH